MLDNLKGFLENNEIIEKLMRFKDFFIKTKDFSNWINITNEAKEKFHLILSNNDFENGGILASSDLNEIFHLMKRFSSNQSLNRLIYEVNSIVDFNNKLRNLYYSDESFAKRINEFLELSNVGEQTLSQFLVIFNDKKYPLSTHHMKQVLNLDATQIEIAKKLAIDKYSIINPETFSSTTIEYLKYTVVYDIIKEILDLESYYYINLILWKYSRDYPSEIEEEEGPFVTFGYENDLRDYLAENPNLIETGLSIIENGVEYNTNEVGRIDLLCKDKDNNYVVVELKRKRTIDAVVGQILRYIGWIQENLGENVRGIIILGEPYKYIDFAIKPVENFIKLKYYRLRFEITDDYQED